MLTVLFLLPPQSRNSGPRLGLPKFPESSGSTEWSLAPSASHVKRGRFTFDTKRPRSHSRCPEHAKLRTWSWKVALQHKLPFLPTPPARILQAERNTRRLVFSTPSLPRCQRGCSAEQPRKALFSSLLLTCPEAWPAGADGATRKAARKCWKPHSLWLRSRLPCASPNFGSSIHGAGFS